jgi:5-methyltetrahydropteroyltriglutamate--homocysteine methyltransferase
MISAGCSAIAPAYRLRGLELEQPACVVLVQRLAIGRAQPLDLVDQELDVVEPPPGLRIAHRPGARLLGAGELIGELVQAGFHYIQLDCPRYSALVMAETRERMRELGMDPAGWLEKMIACDNRLIDAFPEVTWGLHVCRGNHRSTWYAEGGYDPIGEQLFTELHVDRLFLEYDTPRAGTFAPLRFVAADKTVVLGLLTTKKPDVEADEDVIRRIEEASRYVPLERLALSPQCGFASTFPGNLVGEEAQRRKLQTVARVAQTVWS